MVNKVVTPATREQTSAVLWPRPPLDYVCLYHTRRDARSPCERCTKSSIDIFTYKKTGRKCAITALHSESLLTITCLLIVRHCHVFVFLPIRGIKFISELRKNSKLIHLSIILLNIFNNPFQLKKLSKLYILMYLIIKTKYAVHKKYLILSLYHNLKLDFNLTIQSLFNITGYKQTDTGVHINTSFRQSMTLP